MTRVSVSRSPGTSASEDPASTRVSSEALAKAEQSAIAEEVASLLRHDLRNRLAIVRNASVYVRKRLGGTDAWNSDPRLETFSKIIETEIGAANELLADRMNLRHLFARSVETVDAAFCLADAVATSRPPNASLVQVETCSCQVTVDAVELALAVRCLIENALEATEADGQPVRVRARTDEKVYAVDVVDAGPGIPADRLSDAQRAFFTTKPGHAGLGLNIASRIAGRYGGAVEIAPVAEGGLRVTLSLPRATP